jgi:hypothetical protein
MPTNKYRILVPVEPGAREAVKRFAKLTGSTMTQVLATLINRQISYLNEVSDALEVAQSDSKRAVLMMHDIIKRAQSEIHDVSDAVDQIGNEGQGDAD